jgi:hypothetical protein
MREAIRFFALTFALSGCAPVGLVTTVVTKPAHADPGETGYGTGTSLAAGAKFAFVSAGDTVVAATSEVDGPSDRNEGDSLWRVRSGMLEHCEWSADGRDDCRLATYEGLAGARLAAFFPSIVPVGDVSRRSFEALSPDAGGFESTSKRTRSVGIATDHSIWVTGASPSIFGVVTIFLCAPHDDGPTCTSMPFTALGIVAALHERRGNDVVSVLWVHAGPPTTEEISGFVIPTDGGMYRCESIAGEARCARAKEIVQ